MTTERSDSQGHDGDTLPSSVRLGDCFRDDYARPINDKHVDRLKNAWDEDAATELLVSLRDDGRYAMIDGAHHAEAARQLFGDDHMMRARVYIDKSVEEEALLYTKVNVSQKRLTRPDIFKAKLVARDDDALALKALAEDCHFTVAVDKTRGLQSVAVLERLYSQVGVPMLADTLLLLHTVWGDDPANLRGEAIGGALLFLARYQPSIKKKKQLDRLLGVLRTEGPDGMMSQLGIMRKAFPGAAAPIAWGRGLLSLYNKGLSNQKLGEWIEHRQPSAAARTYEPLFWHQDADDEAEQAAKVADGEAEQPAAD